MGGPQQDGNAAGTVLGRAPVPEEDHHWEVRVAVGSQEGWGDEEQIDDNSSN